MNTETVLTRLKIDHESRTVAVQQVREMCEASDNPIAVAEHILKNLTAGVEFELTDANEARMLAAHLVQDAITLGEQYDPTDALARAAAKIAARRKSDPWLFAKDAPVVPELDASGTKVVLEGDAKLKKGMKQVLAAKLYETNAHLENKDLIKLFEKELDMSTAGARTYVYSLRKKQAT